MNQSLQGHILIIPESFLWSKKSLDLDGNGPSPVSISTETLINSLRSGEDSCNCTSFSVHHYNVQPYGRPVILLLFYSIFYNVNCFGGLFQVILLWSFSRVSLCINCFTVIHIIIKLYLNTTEALYLCTNCFYL